MSKQAIEPKTKPKRKTKHPGGRPRKYTSVDKFCAVVDAYFVDCEEQHRPQTMSGLAVALDMDRRSLLNYASKDEFFPAVKVAKSRVEAYAASQLYRSSQVAGVIFDLKNNHGWRDQTQLEHTGKDGGPVHFVLTAADEAL